MENEMESSAGEDVSPGAESRKARIRGHIDIREFGAVGDGTTLCTRSICDAIEEAAKPQSTGTVYIPKGVWLSGTIAIPSNITLDIAGGATLLGSGNIADYTAYARNVYNPENHVDIQMHHLLIIEGAENVTIRGGGCIDGNGEAFWDPPRNCEFFTARPARPSPMIEMRNSKNVTIENIVVANSPGWTVHASLCESIRMRGIEVRNNMFGPNTDGIDITDSKDVFVSDCNITAGDDAIVLKSLGGICERIVVTNCITRTRCSALKLGCSESLGIIRRVTMSNCVVHDSSRGISLFCVAGGLFEDVTFSNMVLETDNDLALVNPIHIHCSRRPGGSKPDRGLGKIRNIRVNGLLVKSDARILLTNQDGGELENIFLSNILMEYPQKVENQFEWARRAESGQFSCYCPDARAAQACVVAYNVKNLILRDIVAQWPDNNTVPMHFCWARNVQNGFIDCPQGKASNKDVKNYDLENCDIRIRE